MEDKYSGLRIIISGGQFGTDRGALVAALGKNVRTGGWAPKNFITVRGITPDLHSTFHLNEDYNAGYASRTWKNVLSSDATLIIATSLRSPGTALTISCAHSLEKKMFVIKLPVKKHVDVIESAVQFIIDNQIEVLNVAGNRDHSLSTIHHDAALEIISLIIDELEGRKFLNTSEINKECPQRLLNKIQLLS